MTRQADYKARREAKGFTRVDLWLSASDRALLASTALKYDLTEPETAREAIRLLAKQKD